MGFDVAGVFYNITEEGKEYYNIMIDDVLKEMFPFLKEIKFSMKETPIENRTDKSPLFKISAYKPKQKE